MQKRKRIAVIVIAAFLAAIMILSVMMNIFVVSASAVTQSQIDSLKDDAAALETKQNELQSQIDSRTDDLSATMAKYELLEQQVDLTQQEIDNLNQQIDICEQLIEEKKIEYENAVVAEEEQLQHLKTRVRAMEENGTVVSYIEILFQASSFSDLLARLDLISAIMESDQKLADELEQAKIDVATAQQELEDSKAEYEAVELEQEAKKAELETQVAEAQSTMDYLQANIDELSAAYDANEAEEDALQAQIDDLMTELKRQEEQAKLDAQNKPSSGGSSSSGGTGYVGTGSTGQYIWPATSTYVTSSFGTRWHPVLGGYRTHYGIDIGASYGTNIYAADGGTVEISTYSSSYGNYVLINHGGGNATLYAHMSTRYVEAGDSVSQGDVIGLVGSTGISTGPHLHFEVRENGTRVDPMKYFS